MPRALSTSWLVLAASLAALACDPPERGPEVQSSEKVMLDAAAVPVLRPADDGSYYFDAGNQSFAAVVYPTGEVAFRDWGEGGFSEVGVRISGPAEWAQRAGENTRHAREKAAFLEKTAEQRTKLAEKYRKLRGAAVLAGFDGQLKATFLELKSDPPALRKRLFELWDECLEGDAPEGAGPVDAARHSYGQAARAEVIRFVREQLPAGSDMAYAPEELERLNAGRSSKATFAPYPAPTPGQAAPEGAADAPAATGSPAPADPEAAGGDEN